MTRHTESRAPSACPPRADLLAYVLNELAADRRPGIDDHLTACSGCVRERGELAGWAERIKAVPREPLRRDLTAGILARLPADAWSPAPRRAGKLVGFPLLARVAAVLLAVAGLCALVSILRPPGDARSEAVRGALGWLEKAQEPDGGWDAVRWGAQKNYGVGVSALAVMAFMGDDAGVLKGPHAETVRRGIDYLVSRQNEQGLVGPRFTSATYNHGLATLALLRACDLEHHDEWQAAAGRAVRFICSAQTESGGWGYLRSGEVPPNTSATIWPLRALLRAEAMGYPGVRPHIEKAFAWLRGIVNEDGHVGYVRSDEFPYGRETLTAAGTVCFLLDEGRSGPSSVEIMLSSVRRAAAQPPEEPDFYRAYFVAEALGLSGGGLSAGALSTVHEQLAALQRRTGPEAGSWDADDRWGRVGGRVYSTAMAALALQRI